MVKGQGDVALLSHQAAEDVDLVEYNIEATTLGPPLHMSESRQNVVDIVQEYKDVFIGIGKLKGCM